MLALLKSSNRHGYFELQLTPRPMAGSFLCFCCIAGNSAHQHLLMERTSLLLRSILCPTTVRPRVIPLPVNTVIFVFVPHPRLTQYATCFVDRVLIRGISLRKGDIQVTSGQANGFVKNHYTISQYRRRPLQEARTYYCYITRPTWKENCSKLRLSPSRPDSSK